MLHHRLGHRSTRSLLAGDTANVWEDVGLRIDPDSFCTSCQISPMNKKARSKIPLRPKAPFKWIFMKTETEHLCNRGDIVQDSLMNKSSE